MDSLVEYIQTDRPLHVHTYWLGVSYSGQNALCAYALYNSEITFTGSHPTG